MSIQNWNTHACAHAVTAHPEKPPHRSSLYPGTLTRRFTETAQGHWPGAAWPSSNTAWKWAHGGAQEQGRFPDKRLHAAALSLPGEAQDGVFLLQDMTSFRNSSGHGRGWGRGWTTRPETQITPLCLTVQVCLFSSMGLVEKRTFWE